MMVITPFPNDAKLVWLDAKVITNIISRMKCYIFRATLKDFNNLLKKGNWCIKISFIDFIYENKLLWKFVTFSI